MATITVSEFATELDTDARTARKFLRSVTDADSQPGKGGRWSIEKREVRSLKSKFAKWGADEATKRAERDLHRETPLESNDAPDATDDDASIDIEPTDDELAEIENA